jgi:hypothetical protein
VWLYISHHCIHCFVSTHGGRDAISNHLRFSHQLACKGWRLPMLEAASQQIFLQLARHIPIIAWRVMDASARLRCSTKATFNILKSCYNGERTSAMKGMHVHQQLSCDSLALRVGIKVPFDRAHGILWLAVLCGLVVSTNATCSIIVFLRSLFHLRTAVTEPAYLSLMNYQYYTRAKLRTYCRIICTKLPRPHESVFSRG